MSLSSIGTTHKCCYCATPGAFIRPHTQPKCVIYGFITQFSCTQQVCCFSPPCFFLSEPRDISTCQSPKSTCLNIQGKVVLFFKIPIMPCWRGGGGDAGISLLLFISRSYDQSLPPELSGSAKQPPGDTQEPFPQARNLFSLENNTWFFYVIYSECG